MNKKSAPQPNPPVWSRRVWTGTANLEVSVFENHVGNGEQEFRAFTCTAKRTYKTETGYQEAKSFRAEDVPTLVQLLTQAFTFITEESHKVEE